ncbi:hypothetical protein ACU686_08045 [Yinghuangia aomiensis]
MTPRPAAARGATRRPEPLPGTRRASIGGTLLAGYGAGMLRGPSPGRVHTHRNRLAPHADRPPYSEHPPHSEPRLHDAPAVRDDSAPHFVLKPGPLPGHTEPREPNAMPRDGKRRTAAAPGRIRQPPHPPPPRRRTVIPPQPTRSPA